MPPPKKSLQGGQQAVEKKNEIKPELMDTSKVKGERELEGQKLPAAAHSHHTKPKLDNVLLSRYYWTTVPISLTYIANAVKNPGSRSPTRFGGLHVAHFCCPGVCDETAGL